MTSSTLLAIALLALTLGAQAQPGITPLRTPPTERLTVAPGPRDWAPATIANTTLLVGNSTGEGGLFAIDTVTGKRKWTHRPSFPTGTASVSTPPAVMGDIVISSYSTAYPGALVALSLATGKEFWRGPDPAQNAAPAVNGGLAYILSKSGSFHALDVATGKERWKVAVSTVRGGCASRPIVRDDVIYFTATADATPGDASRRAGAYLLALNANTGQEIWRYRAEAPYVHDGVCLRQPVVTADVIYAAGDNYLYAIDRATGRNRWKPLEVRRTVEGRERPVEIHGLVDAASVVVGLTSSHLIAFDKATGRTAWELPGRYSELQPSTAVAGDVLYFQGSPQVQPAVANTGTLYALDLATHAIRWSFSRPTAERNWAFGAVTPVNGGLWVNSYQAIVKLQ